MGKILQIFHDNRDVILRGLSLNLSKIVDLLQKKGVYKEEETHGLQDDSLYNIVKNIFSRVDAGGYYAEFVDALTEAGKKSVAKLVRRKLICMCMFCRSLFVLFLLAIALSVLLRYTDSDYPFGIFKLFINLCLNFFNFDVSILLVWYRHFNKTIVQIKTLCLSEMMR